MIPVLDVYGAVEKAQDVAKLIEPTAKNAMRAFMEVGTLLGSIFILFVIFYYVTSLLDGGKFQMKMLLPLGLYILVASFSSTVGPLTISFTGALRKSLVTSAAGAQVNLLEQHYHLPADLAAKMRLIDVMVYDASKRSENEMTLQDQIWEQVYGEGTVTAQRNDDGSYQKTQSTGDNYSDGKSIEEKLGNVAQSVEDSIKKWWLETKANVILSVYRPPTELKVGDSFAMWFMDSIVMFFLTIILDTIVSAMAIVMVMLGIVMTYILVAFGPVTWSFAIFPGNGKILGSWFVRLSQFTLYGPVAMIIRTFIWAICSVATDSLASSSVSEVLVTSGFSTLLFITLALVAIIALMNVPTICSFIIEGASGAVSVMGSASTAMGVANMFMNKKQLQNDETVKQAVTGKSGGSQ